MQLSELFVGSRKNPLVHMCGVRTGTYISLVWTTDNLPLHSIATTFYGFNIG